ncbi:MAG TPA: hypothetical protein DIT25_03530 [Candidatus Moranbacteria bacterium]|nr:hypothetical protein [Candidatus Moranbacteria bacterium]
MSLSEIKKKLYSSQADENLSQHSQNEYDSKSISQSDLAGDSNDVWAEKDAGLEDNQKNAIKIGAFVIVGITVLSVLVFGTYRYMQSAFSESNVAVNIEGPKDASSGKLLDYEISYENRNRASLKGTVLRVSYPENFKPGENANFKSESLTSGVFALGDIAGKSSGKIIFSGNAYSPKGTLMYLKADLIYSPSNASSQYVSRNQYAINVDSSPIELEIFAPQKISSGDSVDYQINYTNTGKEDFDGIRIRLEYPETFSFSRANPAPSEGEDVWYIGRLEAGHSGKIIISGKLEGGWDEVKNVHAYLGKNSQDGFWTYSEEKTSTSIIAPPIIISQTVNGMSGYAAKPGEVLRFEIGYKNNTSIALRDVIIKEKIDSPVLDYASLELRKGGFDPNSKTIIWKGVDDPSLKLLSPGQSGSVIFSIKVKEMIPISNSSDKNFIISANVKIDSPDIQTPIGSNKIVSGNVMDIRLNSKLVLDGKGYFNDSDIPNSGPIPAKIGEATTYTIRWKAMNVSNDVNEAKVTASLPTGIIMAGNIFPEDERLTYNERDNSIIWDIGKMEAGDGILKAPREVAFQIRLVPAQNQFDTMPTLIGPAVFSAKDLFTGNIISTSIDKKTTALTEDSGIGTNYKIVR